MKYDRRWKVLCCGNIREYANSVMHSSHSPVNCGCTEPDKSKILLIQKQIKSLMKTLTKIEKA